jgi:carbon monoxide dehydrogenase subunit G
MSSLRIEERFELDAQADEAWAYFTHPERIVVCLPGAELTEIVDERNYAGGVKVKLGAVAMEYRGKVEFTEVDVERRVIRMVGKGSEKRGGGTATLTMETTVHELDGARSAVTVVADIQLAGKIVRFGRGMIQAVTAEVFKEFTTRLADELAGGGSAGASDAGVPTDGVEAVVGPSPESLPLLPLLSRSFRSWLRRLFGRE